MEEVTVQRFCENCGEELKGTPKFCPKCGQKILYNDAVIKKEKSNEKKTKTIKVVTGVITVALVGGVIGVGGGYVADQHMNMKKIEEKVESNGQGKKNREFDLEKLRNLYKNNQFAYVEYMCSYLPQYSSSTELTQEELKMIYQDAFDYYSSLNHYRINQHSFMSGQQYDIDDYMDRDIISDDKLVDTERDENTDMEIRWKFSNDVFEKFNEIADVEFDFNELNSNKVTYDGEYFDLIYTEDREDFLECELKNALLDEENGNIVVNIEKVQKKNDKTEKIEEHAVLVLSDNQYGYKIKSIENGYKYPEQSLESIEYTIGKWEGTSIQVANIFDNFQYNEENTEDIVKQLAKRGYFFLKSTQDENGAEINREDFFDACEVVGISREDSDIEIDDDEIKLNSNEYVVKNADMGSGAVIRNYLLRTEINKKNKEVLKYYLTTKKNENSEEKQYLQRVLTFELADNVYGYQIKSIVSKEWNDKYKEELNDIEQKSNVLEQKCASIHTESEGAEWVQQEKELWDKELDNIMGKIKDKYPEKEQMIDKNTKKYLEKIDADVADWYTKPNENASEEEKMFYQVNTISSKQSRIQSYCYFLIGNCLMDNHIEEIVVE